MDNIDPVLLGKVIKPHGIKGEIKIFPYSGQPENFLLYKEIILADNRYCSPELFQVEKSRVQGKIVLMKLGGISTKSHAQELTGQHVWIRRDRLPELSENEYYWHDIQGKDAVIGGGKVLGEIVGIMDTGAHDVLAVRNNDQEYLIPVCNEYVIGYDGDKVVLKLPPGLLDINNS